MVADVVVTAIALLIIVRFFMLYGHWAPWRDPSQRCRECGCFTVVSPTEIDAIVPPFVTTGYAKVTLPSGRIPSNQKFHVMPQITSSAPSN